MPCGTGQRGSGVGMDLKRLEYFCAIVEKGQISKAAEALHISQPPLSMRLKELEEELDVQLIYREGKAWQVTPEGEALYQRAQFILILCCGSGKGYSGKPEQGLRPGADRGVPAVPLAGKYTHSGPEPGIPGSALPGLGHGQPVPRTAHAGAES